MQKRIAPPKRGTVGGIVLGVVIGMGIMAGPYIKTCQEAQEWRRAHESLWAYYNYTPRLSHHYRHHYR